MKNPKVSVIIPTYNRAYLLPRTIKSVLNQTFKDFELIIVDDGSTDNTKEIVEDFQKKDNRIKYIWQENSGGPARPKNTGIKNSKGEFLAFLDSDDEWLSEKLEKQLELFEKNKDLGIVGCNCWNVYVGEENKKIECKINKNGKNNNYSSRILGDCFIFSSSSIMIPRFVFDDIGFYDERFRIADDWDLYIRILEKYNFDFVKEPLFNYYIHNGNISGNAGSSKLVKDDIYILEKHIKKYNNNLSAKSKIIRHIGTYYMVSGDKKNARKYFWQSVKCAPCHLRNYINLFLSFFGVRVYSLVLKQKQKNR